MSEERRRNGLSTRGLLAKACALAACLVSLPLSARQPETAEPVARPTAAEVIAGAGDDEWRRPNPENLVLFELESGTVLVELVPAFAPNHLEAIRRLVRTGSFDGGRVVRSQDNYVAQWTTRPPAEGSEAPVPEPLDAELERSAVGVPFVGLEDPDPYAPETGFAIGQRVARDPDTGTMWLVHCYGAVGVARDEDPDSGNGTQLYAVTGHAPRHLDRNMTMIGRVVSGMENLSALPRGTGDLGFYESEEEEVALKRAVIAADLPEAERPKNELMRTNAPSFAALIAARRTRTEPFFVHRVDAVGVCNVPIPSRVPSSEGRP